MLRHVSLGTTALSLLLLLPGCDEINGRNIGMSGAGIVLDQGENPYQPSDLANLITAATPPETPSIPAATATAPGATAADPVAPAIARFTNALYNPGADLKIMQNRLRDSRNAIQGVLIMTSGNRCNAFKLRLRQKSGNIAFGLGSVSTTLGAAGALFTNGTSQILSGMAGAASGVNAEYQKDILSNLATSVIIPGIDKQRSGLMQEIVNRRCLGVSSYSISNALADVIRYHAACSTDVGITAAGAAINASQGQSIDDVANAVTAINKLHAALNPAKDAPAAPAKPAAAGKPAAPAADGQGTADATPQAAKPAGNQSAPLVGDSVDFETCDPLNADGSLPADTSAKTAAAKAGGSAAAATAAGPNIGKPKQSVH